MLEGTQWDVVLVRKRFNRRRARAWGLQRMDREKNEGDAIAVDDEQDMEDLMAELEEDPELRRGVNMYRKEVTGAASASAATAAGAAGAEEDEDDEDEEA